MHHCGYGNSTSLNLYYILIYIQETCEVYGVACCVKCWIAYQILHASPRIGLQITSLEIQHKVPVRGSEIETGFIGGGGLFSWLSIQLSLFPSCRGADQRLDRDCTIHHPREFFSNYCACRISQLSQKNSREAYIVQVQYANLARSAKAVARFMHPLLPSNMDYSWQWKLDDCYFKRVTQGRLRLAKQR